MKKTEKDHSAQTEKLNDLINHLQKVISEIDYSQKACMQTGKMECQLLLYLHKVQQVVNMNELAGVLNVSHSRITRIMDNLVDKELVIRKPSEEDRRCWYAIITDKGNKMAEASKQTMYNQQERIIKLLTEEKAEEVIKALDMYVKAYEVVLKETLFE